MFSDFIKQVYKKSLSVKDEVPVCCMIVDERGSVISRAFNKSEKKKNGCLHAEMIAMEKALKKLNKPQEEQVFKEQKLLQGCVLYVNLEPCIMCGYAASLNRVKTVVFGAKDERFGFFSNNIDKKAIHKMEYYQLMGEECKSAFDRFFKDLRKKP